MKRSTITNIIFGIFTIFLFTNCSDPVDDGPTLTVTPSTITLEADGSGKTISVTSNTSWTVRADDSWVKYSPTGGTGGSSITVSALVNTGDERSSKLTLSDKTGRATAEVRITQKKADSSTPTPTSEPVLTVKPSSISFNSSAGSNTFVIESNTSWTVRSDQTWCTVNTSSGSNNATITVNVTENTSTSARNAAITISSDKASSVQVSISQAGSSPGLQLNKNDMSFSAAGGSDTFIITSNTSWSITSNQTWCTVSTSSGSNNGTITVSVIENTSTDSRSATITVKASDITQTIAVKQAGTNPTLQLSKSSMSFDALSGNESFSITSNTNWTVTSNRTWCTLSSSSGSNNATVTVYVSENSSTSERSASVTVKAGDVSKIIEVKQGGATPVGQNVRSFLVGDVRFNMIEVDGGTFTMGATIEQVEEARDDEIPAHTVTLSSYSIGETEVTQALWQAVMGSNPSYFSGSNKPVERVSWDECQDFIKKLNSITGEKFRLPTEAEWEFAARGGNKSRGYKYAGSNTLGNVAWYSENIPSQSSGTAGYGTQNVATKQANELGLYDMSGNVFEWCGDFYGNYSSSSQTNPTGPNSGKFRIIRGGAWDSDAWRCRVSYRFPSYYDLDDYSNYLGFRLAL